MKKKIYKSAITNIKVIHHNLSLIEKISLLSIEKICYVPLPTYSEFIKSFNNMIHKIICILQHYGCTKKIIYHLVKIHNNFVVALAMFSNYVKKQSVMSVSIINPCDGEIIDYDVNYEEYLTLIGSGSPLNINLHNKIRRYKYILYAIKKKLYHLYKTEFVKNKCLEKNKRMYKIELEEENLCRSKPKNCCKVKNDCNYDDDISYGADFSTDFSSCSSYDTCSDITCDVIIDKKCDDIDEHCDNIDEQCDNIDEQCDDDCFDSDTTSTSCHVTI